MQTSLVVFDFNQDSSLSDWYVVDDGVMGGRSLGNFATAKEGHAVFSGDVSLENNGGFSSIRYRMRPLIAKPYTSIAMRIKGDGKNYQLRVKSETADYFSYVGEILTTGDWQTVVFNFEDLYPVFRGRELYKPNYPGDQLGEIGFLIGNKEAEKFDLKLDWIELR